MKTLTSREFDAHILEGSEGAPLRGCPEADYAAFAALAHRRKLGQFFTPPRVADLMADWVSEAQPKSVLDPAMGTGVLLRAVAKRFPTAELTGFDVDPSVLRFSKLPAGTRAVKGDFLASTFEEKYDGIIMNPPYIRHREIRNQEDSRVKISTRSKTAIPKSANLYIYFTVKALLQLNPGGRASVLIPSEWLNANFSGKFKTFLLDNNFLRELICFSSCSNVFDDALTTASVLLIEKVRDE